jgi:hypothetical protein
MTESIWLPTSNDLRSAAPVPPAITFLDVMQKGLDGMYDDAAIEYIFRHFIKYYQAGVPVTSGVREGK